MDSDGANHLFLTSGQAIALTPRYSPDYKSIVYLSYAGKRPRIYIYNLGSGQQRLVTEGGSAALHDRMKRRRSVPAGLRDGSSEARASSS